MSGLPEGFVLVDDAEVEESPRKHRFKRGS